MHFFKNYMAEYSRCEQRENEIDAILEKKKAEYKSFETDRLTNYLGWIVLGIMDAQRMGKERRRLKDRSVVRVNESGAIEVRLFNHKTWHTFDILKPENIDLLEDLMPKDFIEELHLIRKRIDRFDSLVEFEEEKDGYSDRNGGWNSIRRRARRKKPKIIATLDYKTKLYTMRGDRFEEIPAYSFFLELKEGLHGGELKLHLYAKCMEGNDKGVIKDVHKMDTWSYFNTGEIKFITEDLIEKLDKAVKDIKEKRQQLSDGIFGLLQEKYAVYIVARQL